MVKLGYLKISMYTESGEEKNGLPLLYKYFYILQLKHLFFGKQF